MITYIATNRITGKFYIGSTNDFQWRKYCHLKKVVNYPFQNALRKHPEDFIWETHEDDSEDPILEQALLDMFYGTEQCYNLNPVANRPPTFTGHSEETISKMLETRSTLEYKQNARGKTLAKFLLDEEFKRIHQEKTIQGSNTPEAKRKKR
jgi:group I intron endonuclease